MDTVSHARLEGAVKPANNGKVLVENEVSLPKKTDYAAPSCWKAPTAESVISQPRLLPQNGWEGLGGAVVAEQLKCIMLPVN